MSTFQLRLVDVLMLRAALEGKAIGAKTRSSKASGPFLIRISMFFLYSFGLGTHVFICGSKDFVFSERRDVLG